MIPNNAYGNQTNFMPPQGNQPYYQSPITSPRPPAPIMNPPMNQPVPMNQPPQMSQPLPMNQHPPMNQQPQMNPYPTMNQQPPMNQPPPMNQHLMMNQNPPTNQQPIQYGQNQMQYGRNAPNSGMYYPPPTAPPVQYQRPSTPYAGQNQVMNGAQNYTMPQQNQAPNYPMAPNQLAPQDMSNAYPNSNQYGANTAGNFTGVPPQSGYGAPAQNPHNYVVPVPINPQQYAAENSQVAPGNLSNPPPVQLQSAQSGEPYNIQNNPQVSQPPTEPPREPEQPTKQDVSSRMTNVIGQYKCSDFPNLYTGPFRYSTTPVQRKPFTMKNTTKCGLQHNQVNADRKSIVGFTKSGKRWELRGGKYYGCFTSRTNGLQDNCPKVKCKLCPHDHRKK